MSISKVRLPNNTEEDIKAKYLIQSTSADAVSAEFSARTVTEDAIANIQKIYGNTITWNQLSDAQTTSATFDGTQIARGGIMCSGSSVQIYSGHKYLIYYHVTTTVTGQIQWKARILNSGIEDSYTASGSFNRKMIFTATAAVKTSLNLFNNTAFTPSSGDTMSIRFDCLFDLTAIYGSGNEPTVSEFEEQFPTDYYPYSPLTLLSNLATSIQSTDSSNNVIGNCDLNIPTLTGKLNGTGSSVVIFPDGLKKVGTVYDEIVGNKAIKRVGSVDLGTLSFTYNTTYVTDTPVFYARVIGRKTGSAHLLSALYYVAGPSRPHLEGTNMAMASHNSSSADAVDFTNSSYTDAAVFKTAMSGVTLYYELATPEEYILDNALQLQYPVVAGGTEMVLPTSGTAPMKMDVIYGNAADATSNLSSNFISVDSMKAFLNNLGTQMGGTWNMQYNNGKFEFTFSSS